ncbi:monocarboxylate transporter 1-like isoform X2 [Mobula birostris]|uniref:monocarboxylate transporter 1-like isoform X2 n=1 Tax=Mobula birostris TaxID=1983395 RepID=UPI003B28A891
MASQEFVPPDGGWGWAVVIGSFIAIGFSYAFPKAITVYFKEIQTIFNASYSEIAWISSLTLAVMYAGGPISSILVNKYGSRPVMMGGGILCSIGMIAASFCNNIFPLFLCVGCITGLGLAFNLQPALTMIGKYFYKKRPIANGIAMAGSPVFLSTFAPLNQYLVNIFSWRGSFLILGGILLNCCVAGSLMRPLQPTKSVAVKDALKKDENKGWLVDVTQDYRYMYLVCGIIVIVASIFLFIANAINYRLLAKEKKMEEEKAKASLNDAELKDVPENVAGDDDDEDIHINPQTLLANSAEKETNI